MKKVLVFLFSLVLFACFGPSFATAAKNGPPTATAAVTYGGVTVALPTEVPQRLAHAAPGDLRLSEGQYIQYKRGQRAKNGACGDSTQRKQAELNHRAIMKRALQEAAVCHWQFEFLGAVAPNCVDEAEMSESECTAYRKWMAIPQHNTLSSSPADSSEYESR